MTLKSERRGQQKGMKRSLMVTVAMALSPDDKELEQKDEDNRGKKKKKLQPQTAFDGHF